MNINVLEITLEEAQAILSDERLILASREEVLQGQAATARAEKAEAEAAALKAHVERLRVDIESAVERMNRDSDEEESVDTCLNCGDGARDRIDSEQWKFDDHGDMLCRECGAHRGLCGYKVGGLDDVEETLKIALAGTPAQSLKLAQAEALREAAETRLKPFLGHNDGWYSDGIKDAYNSIRDAAEEMQAEAANG